MIAELLLLVQNLLPHMQVWVFLLMEELQWLLPRLIGESRARRFFLSNEILTAKEAHKLGVVDHLVEDKDLIETSIALAESWSGWSPHMIESTKHLLHVQNENDFDTHLKHEQTLIEAAGLTQEFKEGVKKFLTDRFRNILIPFKETFP